MAFATALAFLAGLQRLMCAPLLQSIMLMISFGVWHERRRSQVQGKHKPAEGDVNG
jgi:hypothetical protein